MRFWTSMVYAPVEHYLPVAEALDELGYEGVLLADHLFSVRETVSPYPYSADGTPPWPGAVPFPDVWVTAAALAARTRRLRFGSAVYIAPARDVFGLAKQVGTLAALAPDRVALGVGVGWMREEFDLTGQAFGTRGRRLDEMIDVMRALWAGDWTEYHGRHYDFTGVRMLPAPASPVPLWCGGYSRPALRRAAALCDGWIGVFPDADRGRQIVTALREQLDEHGRDPAGFRIVASVPALGSVEAVEEWEQLGVTDVIVQPWASSARGDSTERHVGGGAALDLSTMVSAVESFAARLAPAFQSS